MVTFSMTDGDRIAMASELGSVQLIGTDADFFTAKITGTTSGEIITKCVVEIYVTYL